MSEEENTETLQEEEYPPHLLIEAALFSAGKPVSEEEISETTGIDRPLIRLYMKKLTQSYSRRETSLEVIKAGKKYTLRIKEPYVEKVTSLANPEDGIMDRVHGNITEVTTRTNHLFTAPLFGLFLRPLAEPPAAQNEPAAAPPRLRRSRRR